MGDIVPVFNQSISPDFQSVKKSLLVDLASAEKITATIREEKMKKYFWKQNNFFKKPSIFLEKSEFYGDKKMVVEKYIFEKSSTTKMHGSPTR